MFDGYVVHRGPWKGPLNWNLHATGNGETFVPFALYVQQELSQPNSTFPLFPQLPTELQLRILQVCDNATLFWLMQVCSALRTEAQKLFWSDPGVWYNVDAHWVLSGGFAGHTYCALDSLRYIKRVELLDFWKDPLGQHFWRNREYIPVWGWRERTVLTEQAREQRIQTFWQVLQHRFPCATHVVLSWGPALFTKDSLPGGPGGLKRLAEESPQGICVYVSFLQEEEGYERRLIRRLWRYNRSHNSTNADWELFAPIWTRQSIRPPLKIFRGPVGDYSRWKHQRIRCAYLRNGRRLLIIQAVEMYYLQGQQRSFNCPYSGCHEQFEQPGQWAAHAIDSGHNTRTALPSEELEALFDEHEARIEDLSLQAEIAFASMRIAWGEDGSQQQQEAERAFLDQLQHDPLYTQELPPHESEFWYGYASLMHGPVNTLVD